MDKQFSNLPLRKGVGVVLLNNYNEVFVAKRIDNPNDFWQMPQGGINKNEDSFNAALRELKEETSIVNVELIKKIKDETTYILPDKLLGIIWKGKFKGQTQKWYVMRFLGTDNEINLKTNHPEFLEWKWIDIENITDKIVDFKLHVYEKIKEELKKLI
tara:strand:+ start:1169 stop:1642 length:474 start_codon:yes stop_codon:yes gene_type:complete